MSLRLTLFAHLPTRFVRSRLLDRLAQATAEAFGSPGPDWAGCPHAERLAAYAEFTAAEAGRVVGASDSDGRLAAEVSGRLYQNARDLGSGCRSLLGIRSPGEAMHALKLLYQQIGIEMTDRVAGAPCDAREAAGLSGAPAHEVDVGRCFFAGHYSEPVCRLMSAMDAGVVAGLFGGAELEFSQRITEASACCRAVIRTTEERA